MMFDIRLRACLEAVLFPSPKEGMKPRSLGFLSKALNPKKDKCALFATFPKSGWNWTGDIMNYCLVKKHTGSYKVVYEGEGTLKDRERKPYRVVIPADGRCWDQKKIRDIFPGVDVDYIFHTHSAWKESPLWFLDRAKTAFITRNVPTALYSYFKSRGDQYASFEDCLAGTGALDRVIRFYNTWGDFAAQPGAVTASFKYEDLRQDPMTGFSEAYRFVFGETIEPDIVAEAVEHFSFERQKEREFKFEKNEARHFHFKGESDYTSKIKPETLDLIYARLRAEARHNFGYVYPA